MAKKGIISPKEKNTPIIAYSVYVALQFYHNFYDLSIVLYLFGNIKLTL